MSSRRQRRSDGAVVAVPLGDGLFGAGRLLREPVVEFFDCWVAAPLDIGAALVGSPPVLFKVCVMNSAVTSGRWPIVSVSTISAEEHAEVHRFFKKDMISGKLSIYWSDPVTGQVYEEAANKDQIQGLECAAVWSAEHVEDRLRDFREGIPNRWVEAMLA